MLRLTSCQIYRCYKELPERLGCVHLLPLSRETRRKTVQRLGRKPWRIYSILGLLARRDKGSK